MIGSSAVGDMQTVFYLVLVAGIVVGLTLFLIGIGIAGLPRLFRHREHPLLATLITGALGLTSLFILVTGGAILYGVSHRG